MDFESRETVKEVLLAAQRPTVVLFIEDNGWLNFEVEGFADLDQALAAGPALAIIADTIDTARAQHVTFNSQLGAIVRRAVVIAAAQMGMDFRIAMRNKPQVTITTHGC